MASVYGAQLKIFIVYVVEAHPIIDVSPYSGTVWVPSANYTDNVLFRQPATYGQRKEIIDSLLAHYTINAPILIDGPCNNWWLNYGPSPNNAYLIDTNGVVFAKNAWFNRVPDNMFCSIDSLIGFNSGHCVINGDNGMFSYTLNGDSTAVGLPSQTLSLHSTLTNMSSTDNCVIDIVKKFINIPAAWQSALCADICYAATVDSTRITLAPSEVQPFYFYFYSDINPDSGYVRVLFRNVTNANNRFGQGYYGFTSPDVSVEDVAHHPDLIRLFPNPVSSQLNFSFPAAGNYSVSISSATGGRVTVFPKAEKDFSVDVNAFPVGIYFVTVTDEKRSTVTRKFVKF
jgi:hypothetical protein